MKIISALFSVILSVQAWSAENPAQVISRIGFDQKLDSQIPLELEFKNEAGRSVRLKEYFRGKPIILSLVYNTCPYICGASQTGLVTCLRVMTYSVGKEFDIITVSINPEETTVLSAAKKSEYTKSYGRAGAAEGWHYLTGNKQSIEALTHAVGYKYEYDATSKQFAHPTGIVLLTPEGKISKYYFGIEYYPRDLSLGLVEASQNKIGTVADQVVLYCLKYDPMTGKYGLVISRILKLLGVMTVLALGSFIVAMIWRDARLKKAVLNNRRATGNG
jgi:protein SCO1/2